MKNKSIDCLHDMVGTLCRQLDDPSGLTHLYEVMVAVIELARTDRAWRAVNVANEVVHHLARMAEERGQELGDRLLAEERGTPIGIGTVAPAWNLGVERMRIHSDGYVQIRPEAPKPVATVEQMRAAADAALVADQELVEWDCSVCHKKTLTDDFMPVGWARTLNSNTGDVQYTCVECQMFGIKVPKKERQYQCMGCDAETTSIAFPPPGWKEVEDGEVICFGCAEADAEAGDV